MRTMHDSQGLIPRSVWKLLAFSRGPSSDSSAKTQATARRLLPTMIAVVLLILISGCTAPTQPPASQPFVPIAIQPISTTFDPARIPGPTRLAKVAEGYELTNTLYRVVIDDQTGNVIYWGFIDQSRNMVFHRGIYATLTNLPDAVMHNGYIEKRDEQTWQFFGEDDNHISWRKIYCLDGRFACWSASIIAEQSAPM